MGRKLGMCPFLGGGAGFPSNTKSPGPRPTDVPSGILKLIHPAGWPQQTWTQNGGLCLFSGESWVPIWRNFCLGQDLPQCQVSFWSIQPFGHNTATLETGRQTGQDRIDRTGQRSDSIGRTVLQRVAKKAFRLSASRGLAPWSFDQGLYYMLALRACHNSPPKRTPF